MFFLYWIFKKSSYFYDLKGCFILFDWYFLQGKVSSFRLSKLFWNVAEVEVSKKKTYFSNCFGVVRDSDWGKRWTRRKHFILNCCNVWDDGFCCWWASWECVFINDNKSKSAIDSRKQHEQNANCLIAETLFSELLPLINGHTRNKSNSRFSAISSSMTTPSICLKKTMELLNSFYLYHIHNISFLLFLW